MMKLRLICFSWLLILFYYFPLKASADFNQLMQCTSKLVYNLKGDSLLLARLAELVQQEVSHVYVNENITDLVGECRTYEERYIDQPSQSQSLYLAQIDNIPTTSGIKNLFKGFAKPTRNCYSIGGYLGTHLVIVGLTGTLDIASCRSTLGNRWLELRPSGELTFGPGLVFLSFGGNIGWDTNIPYASLPVSLTYRASLDFSNWLALRLASRGQIIPNTIGIGFDFGGKYAASLGGQLNFSVLPLGTDYDYLKQRLSRIYE